jgi:type IV pilus assembly protein PilM
MAKANQQGVWGIDVGQCALKALRLEMIDGTLTATAFDYVEHPKILSQPDADADQLTREALEKFLSRNTLRGDVVCISVPGQGGLARFVKLPPVEEKKITDIVRFEAKQQIPFRLEEVVWDFQKIGSGTVTDGFAMETEIGLFAMKRDMVNRYLQHFKDVNVEVQITQLAPLALCNFVSYDLLHQEPGGDKDEAAGKKRCIVALDIGADNSNLVITDADRIIWQRPIPLGGNHFTRALTKDFKLTFAKAEHLKRNAIKSPELKKILSSLKPVLNDFVGEVQRSLGYFTNTHRDAHVEYMVGLGNAFRLPGLQKFLSEKLQLEVKKLGKLERLSGDGVTTAPQYTENVLSFAVAYGLALQGLKLARLHTNLLPQEIQLERMVRAKKPWAAAGAAALLLGMVGLAACLASGHRKLNNPEVTKAMDESKKAVDQANGYIASFKTIEDNIAAKTLQTQQMAAGQAEQLNWSLLLQYINECLPRPNGDKIPKEWYDELARKANKWVEDGHRIDEEVQQNLPQVNIEAILPLYSDDLPGFLGRVYKAKPSLEGMPEDQQTQIKKKDKLPKSGWVIEIRGYTYFSPLRKEEGDDNPKRIEPRQFLIDSLCENLSNPAKFNPMPEIPAGVSWLTPQERKLWDTLGLLTLAEDLHKDQMSPEEKRWQEKIDLWKKKKAIVWDKVRFVVLFKYDSVANPEPGAFKWVKTTLLKSILEGSEGGGGDKKDGRKAMLGPGPNQGGGGEKGGGQAKPDRSSWTPLGELTEAAYKDVDAKGEKGDEEKKVSKVKDLQRTEFHIFLIWEEPLLSESKATTTGGGAK